MRPLLFPLSAAPGLAEGLCASVGLEPGDISRRQFPDGESYVRLASPVAGRDVILLCTLDRPDDKVLPLLFAAAAAREQGARSVGLVAPYLAYMRQDKAFQPGEAVTSVTFARLLSQAVDWLVTLDPHLHRYPRLDSIYSIPTHVATAAAPVAEWIRGNVRNPVLIGPDEESAQWVEHIAGLARARSTVFRKRRSGDFDVSITAAPVDLRDATPVIIDDIASSARTMIEAVTKLRESAGLSTVCVAVHPIFAADAYDRLVAAGPAKIVSTNSIAHPTNAIDISAELGARLEEALAALSDTRRPIVHSNKEKS